MNKFCDCTAENKGKLIALAICMNNSVDSRISLNSRRSKHMLTYTKAYYKQNIENPVDNY